MKRLLAPLVILLAAAVLPACQRDSAPAAAVITPDDIRDPAPDTGTDATVVADMTSPLDRAPPGFDSKGFAGTFTAPDTTLAIGPDGSYRMRVQAGTGPAMDSTGTWTLEPDGRHILLDPERKTDADRRYALASDDELRPDDDGAVLRRRDD